MASLLGILKGHKVSEDDYRVHLLSKARNALQKLISIFEIPTVNRPVIERALESKIQDFNFT
jgi:hypothetical protein